MEWLKEGLNIDGMAVTITLVFADESHREAWLSQNGAFEGEFSEARREDYYRRKTNTNLCYIIGSEKVIKK